MQVGCIILVLMLGLMLIGFLADPSGRTEFRKVVCDPPPASLRGLRASFSTSITNNSTTIRYQLAFSVKSNDVHRIANAKAFETSERATLVTNVLVWHRPERIGTNGQFFSYVRVNRRDFFWVDETGTNCLYLYEFIKPK